MDENIYQHELLLEIKNTVMKINISYFSTVYEVNNVKEQSLVLFPSA